MKVLFLTLAFPKPHTPSLGTWAQQQAMAISMQGITVEVVNMVPYVPQVAGIFSEKLAQYARIASKEQYGDILVHHPKLIYKAGLYNSSAAFRLLWFQLKLVASQLERRLQLKEFHILHAHNLFPDGAVAWMLHRKYRIPYVITLHDVDKTTAIPTEGFQLTVSKAILAEATKVFAVSNRVKSSIAPYINDHRLQLLYNTFWTHETSRPRLPQDQRTIVTIASLIPRKGIDYLLQAFQRIHHEHPDYKLTIIGSGREYAALQELTRSLGIGGSVTFLGAVPHTEAMKLLSEASIFCLPSWNEAFGVSYAESMSMGIPIVGSKGEGIADIVTDRMDGMLAEPRNVGELAEALFYLIENPDVAKQIGQKGKERVKELTPDLFGRKVGTIYREIVGSG